MDILISVLSGSFIAYILAMIYIKKKDQAYLDKRFDSATQTDKDLQAQINKHHARLCDLEVKAKEKK